MAKLLGKWYFNDTTDVPDMTEIDLAFSVTDDAGIVRNFTSIYVDLDISLIRFKNSSDNTYVDAHTSSGWIEQSYQKIDFGIPGYEFDLQNQNDQQFWMWLHRVAIPLTITGSWRFNDKLTSPSSTVYSYGMGESYVSNNFFCKLMNQDTLYNYIEMTKDGELSFWDVSTGSKFIAYTDSEWEDEALVPPSSNYTSEPIIEFLYPTELSVAFATWFHANAKTMEQGLYSKCYIEAAGDKILKFINNANFTSAKKLATGIEKVYEAGLAAGGATALPTLTNPAATGDVLVGKEYIDASGNKKIGTIPEITPTVDGIDYYGVNTVSADGNLVLQLGYHQPSSGYMASGAGSCDGPVLTNIPVNTGTIVVPDTTDKIAVDAGHYVWSSVVVAGDSNLIASNIKKDTTIFGVTGTYEGGGLTVNDMSIGTVGAMPSGDLSLTVTDPSGNFAWKTYVPTNGKVLPENIVAGKTVLGVAGAGAGSGSSVMAGISLAHATGSGKDEQVAIYYMTPEGTQTVQLVNVPASAYATPVSTTFTTVMNAPISVQVSDSTRQLYCYLSDSEFMPLIGTDCGGTITCCVAKTGTANWPMIQVQKVQDTVDYINYPVIMQGIYPDRMTTVGTRKLWHPDTYSEGTNSMAFDLSDFVEGSLTSSSTTAEVTILNKSTRWSVDVQVIARYSVRNQSTGDVVEDTFNYVLSNISPENDSSMDFNSDYSGNPYSDGRWSWEIAGVCFHE